MPVIAEDRGQPPRLPLRGYVLHLDDVQAVLALLRTTGSGGSQVSEARIRVEDETGHWAEVDDARAVCGPEVTAFALHGSDVSLFVSRKAHRAHVEWSRPEGAGRAVRVLTTLSPRHARDWWPVWRPYRAVFVPMLREQAQSRTRDRWVKTGVSAGVIAAAGTVIGLVALFA